jgi:hypothetical protein
MSRPGRILLVLGLLAAVAVLRPDPATAGPCDNPDADICVHVQRHQPGGGGGGGGGGSGSGTSRAPACVWVPTSEVQLPGSGAVGGPTPFDLPMNPGPPPSPDSDLLWERCNGVYTGRLTWSTPGAPAPAPLPTPEDLATDLRAGLERDLPAPEVASDPGAGVASIVNSPVFVAVTNWQDRVDQEDCDPTGALCVTIHAVPALSWNPGEPGAGTVACPPGGSRYDPDGRSPEAQAVGACAHTFTHRTGVAGRPAAWPGQVTITWTVTWESGADGGNLPDVVKSTPVPRPVGEVQAVVTETA